MGAECFFYEVSMYCLNWARAYPFPEAKASFKQTPEDFEVHEFFNTPFSGSGEHLVVQIEKKGLTTEEVMRALARQAQVPLKAIGHAGLKDRQAVATQWLSIHVPGAEIPEIDSFCAPGWRVLSSTRHHKKLRPGYLSGNRFVIRLHQLTHPQAFIERLEQINISGVPNYFGEQRFGKNGNNLQQAELLFCKKIRVSNPLLRGIYYSAARSWIFNSILSKRVAAGNWDKALPGDVVQLQGSQSIFTAYEITPEIIHRIETHDLSPASPLPGKKKSARIELELIQALYDEHHEWILALGEAGMEEVWRTNRLDVEDLQYSIENNCAELRFALPPGSYATAIIRELIAEH